MKYLSCEKIVALHLYKLKLIHAMTFCDKLVEIDPYISGEVKNEKGLQIDRLQLR